MFSLSDSNIEFSILINGSNPIQIYRDPITNSANFVEGRKGSEFQIQVKNNNYYRVCVIPSVDGLSTIDGKTATKDSPSFIIEPRSTIKIPGWTIDHNTISAFKFTDMSKSYSKEVTGTDQKVGVVGIMVFNEKTTVDWYKIYRDCQNNPWINSPSQYPVSQPAWFRSTNGIEFSSLNAVSTSDVTSSSASTHDTSKPILGSSASVDLNADDHLGVGWGSQQDFRVREEEFNKGDKLCVMEIHYDTRKIWKHEVSFFSNENYQT